MKQGRFRVRGSIVLFAAAVAAAFPASALAAPNETKLVSRADGETVDGDADGVKQNGSFVDGPAISADGRFVAFSTNADNLDGGAGPERVYLRDTQNNTVELISRADGATLVNPNGASRNPSVSDDGRFVAFESDADNLIPPNLFVPALDDTNLTTDVFVRDTFTDTTVLASRATSGFVGNDASSKPSISANGQFVAFESDATNLDGGGANGATDVFVRNTVGSGTVLVSRDAAAGDGDSTDASISADGLRVAFDSTATNLDNPADSDSQEDVFLAEMQEVSGNPGVFGHTETTLVSRADGSAGDAGDFHSSEPSISSDGEHVAFASGATNLVSEDIEGIRQIFERNLQTNDTSLVSRADGAGDAGDGLSSKPSISGDGRFVAFEAGATNLDGGGDPASPSDIFLRDTQANETILLSRANPELLGDPVGEPANAQSLRPSISGDGRVTAFYTLANNLEGAVADTDLVDDVYIREADVDIVAPAASIASAPAARTADSTPTVGYSSAASDLAGFECSIDGAAFAACAGSSITTPQLSDGAHDVRVRAFDDAANRGNPVTAAFTVDTAGPATQITSASPGVLEDSTPTIEFTSPDADAAAFQCSVDGAAFAACASPFTTPVLTDGTHTVDVRAVDDVGNVGAPQRASLTVDTSTDPPPVEEKPDNSFELGKAKLNSKKGSAKIPVEVPGPGELALEGKGVKPVSKEVDDASTVNLPVKPKGKTADKLEDKGKAKIALEVTFTPDGGDANSESKNLKLKLT